MRTSLDQLSSQTPAAYLICVPAVILPAQELASACCQPLLSSYFTFPLTQLTGHSLAPHPPLLKNLHKSPVLFAPDHLPGLCVQLSCLDIRRITSELCSPTFSPQSSSTSQTPSRASCIVQQSQSPHALNPWHQTKNVI